MLGGCSVSRAATGGRRGPTWSRSRRGCCGVTAGAGCPGWRGSWPSGSSSSEQTRHRSRWCSPAGWPGPAGPTERPTVRTTSSSRRPVPAANLGAGARHGLARPGARPRDLRRLPWRLLRLRSRARCAGRAPVNPGQLRAAGTRHGTRADLASLVVRQAIRSGGPRRLLSVERAMARHDPGRAPGPSAQGRRPGRTARLRSAHVPSGSTRHASRTTRPPPSASVGPGNARSGTSGTCSPAPAPHLDAAGRAPPGRRAWRTPRCSSWSRSTARCTR